MLRKQESFKEEVASKEEVGKGPENEKSFLTGGDLQENNDVSPAALISSTSLKSEFKNFLALQKGKISALASNALTNEFILEDTQITFKLTNPLEVDAIESIKADLVNHLRTTYKDNEIQLAYEVSSANAEDRPYTPKEKFDAMMKKNPSLKKMKEIMGLDTDF